MSPNKIYKISVPGKIMLSGEYAVLFGGKSLAFTVDACLEAYASLSEDGCFHVSSKLWDKKLVFTNFEDPLLENYKGPLLSALQTAQKHFHNPALKIEITKSLDKSAGVGSSSAVILTCCLASSLFASKDQASMDAIAKLAYSIQKNIQGGYASGYDILTQTYGGLISMQCPNNKEWPGIWERIDSVESAFYKYVHMFAGGRGSSTPSLLSACLEFLNEKKLHESLLEKSESLTETFIHFLRTEKDFASIIEAVEEHSHLLSQFPHYPKSLTDKIKKLHGYGKTWTFKSTGAGGEDSLLFFGKYEDIKEARDFMIQQGWYELQASYTSTGMCYIEDKAGRSL